VPCGDDAFAFSGEGDDLVREEGFLVGGEDSIVREVVACGVGGEGAERGVGERGCYLRGGEDGEAGAEVVGGGGVDAELLGGADGARDDAIGGLGPGGGEVEVVEGGGVVDYCGAVEFGVLREEGGEWKKVTLCFEGL